MRVRTVRLLAVVVIATLTLMPSTAGAGQCSADVNPDPGWVGAVITFTGTGLEPNVEYDIAIGGGTVITLAASPTGTFSYDYTIPVLWNSGESSLGTTEWYVNVRSGCKPMGETAQPYTVLASQPATTTVPPTTLATTTTTASTTTVAGETTTTAAGATTTTSPDVTATTVLSGGDTTTTVAGSDSGGGGMSPIVWIGIAAAIGAVGVFLGRAMGKK